MSNLTNSLDIYSQILPKFQVGVNIFNDKEFVIYDDNYAGAYIDDKGILNIAMVKNDETSVEYLINDNNIVYQEFNYSYNYLQKILNSIESIMSNISIYTVGIDEELNQVFIELNDEEDIQVIIQYLQNEGLYKENAVIFETNPTGEIIETSTIAYGGESILYRYSSNNKARGTLTMNAVSNRTGSLGVLTNSHVAPYDRPMYYGGNYNAETHSFSMEKYIGTASISKQYHSIDAAYVPFSNQEDWEITPYGKYGSTTYDNIWLGNEGQIISGQPIIRIGQTSGVTAGKIKSRNVSSWINGKRLTNLFTFSNPPESGDSGGPIYVNAGEKLYLIGIVFGRGTKLFNKNKGYACRMSNVMNELDVTPITNDSFNTSVLDDGTIQLDGLNFNVSGVFNIPSSLEGRKVSKIGPNAFVNNRNITKIVIPETVTEVAYSAFENCSYLQSITLSSNLVSIGSSAFKNCTSLASINIPNSVTHIDSSAFEGCAYLQTINLSNNMVSIGSSVFKGCASLASITIPSSVTNIDSSAFEGCAYLQDVSLSNNLYAIGTSAFQGCASLSSITIPNSVEHIDRFAFNGCSNLSRVNILRAITGITNLGENVFDGCSSDLEIVVPTERIAEYKNKEYWSSYRNNIVPSSNYSLLSMDCEHNVNENITLNPRYNEFYQLNANCSKSYKIVATSLNDVSIIIYDSNMNVIDNSTNSSDVFLSCGIYYLSFEFIDKEATGQIEMSITLRWPGNDAFLSTGTTNMKTSIHNTIDNKCHGKFYFLNNNGASFFKIYLNAGTNALYPEGTIKIYDNSNRTSLLNRFGLDDKLNLSSSNQDENEMYIYLPKNGYYYISIDLPSSNYSSIIFTIEESEKKSIDYSSSLENIGFSELFFNRKSQSYFKEITISHRSKLELDIVTNGTMEDSIPVYILEKQKELGYEAGDEHYYIIEKLKEDITNINRSPIFTIILNPGTYYIGYFDNFKNVSIQFGLRRIVNQDLNIDGVLVTDPAYNQGYPLGSEVTFNNGVLGGNTITEGFTRNIYLMVEDRLRDPMSRLEYDWYSSNEIIAKVTAYGTVLGLNVTKDTRVTIYAINKKDPSIVYKKELTILKETKTEEIVIESNMSYSYTQENGLYTLELDFTNSPYPYVGYYIWDIECLSDISIDMEYHHLITSTGPGDAILIANYVLNTRVVLMIHLTIVE
ncbi:MAG: leucine-rich repeat protein [Staphylococcus sp.]|nr:leucine-rich repeat protein [Staphylococcus sp.]